MTLWVVHEYDYRYYPIVGIFSTREAAEMRMMEMGWDHDGDPKSYCETWELDGVQTDDGFKIGERHWAGRVRRARIRKTSGGFHRTPIDCARYRGYQQNYSNTGLIIVGDEGPVEEGPEYFACVCSDALIVEGPVEAWNAMLEPQAYLVQPSVEWID